MTTSSAVVINSNLTWMDALDGENMVRGNPLQIAASFIPLSNGGYQVDPNLTSAVHISSGEWVIISDPTIQYFGSNVDFSNVIALLTNENNNTWNTSAVTHDNNGTYSWYVSGSLNSPNKNNYVVALVFEESTRVEVSSAGQALIRFLQAN